MTIESEQTEADELTAARPVPGTRMREVVDQRWKRYAVRFGVASDGTVVIADVRRIRPFPPRYLVP